MFYYTYLIVPTNRNSSLYGKYYFGQRSSKVSPEKDKYSGSGKIIINYIKKHPNDYIKKILKICNTREELDQAEYELIKPHLEKEYCLNLRDGGNTGRMGETCRQKMRDAKKDFTPWNKGKKGVQVAWNKGKTGIYSEETIERQRQSRLGKSNPKLSEYNKTHNAEKNKRNKTGLRVMNNGVINKQVHKEEFDLYLAKGFVFGMIKKK